MCLRLFSDAITFLFFIFILVYEMIVHTSVACGVSFCLLFVGICSRVLHGLELYSQVSECH